LADVEIIGLKNRHKIIKNQYETKAEHKPAFRFRWANNKINMTMTMTMNDVDDVDAAGLATARWQEMVKLR